MGRNLRVRTLTTAADGRLRVGESGDWIEVLSGGAFGYRNKLYPRLRDEDVPLSDENAIPCVAGTIVRASFDTLDLVSPAAVSDSVTVAIGYGSPPPAVTGKPRIRWLARGVGVTIASADATSVVDLTATGSDAYDSTRERFEPLTWCGWIGSTKTFDAYTCVRANPETPTADLIVQKFTSRGIMLLPPGVVGTPVRLCSFDDGAGNAGANPSAPFLPNTSRLWIANTDVASGSFSYLIGVRG